MKLTHCNVYPKGGLVSMVATGEPPGPGPDHRQRSELVKRLNYAFGKEISDNNHVAFAVHVSEKLRGNARMMA